MDDIDFLRVRKKLLKKIAGEGKELSSLMEEVLYGPVFRVQKSPDLQKQQSHPEIFLG